MHLILNIIFSGVIVILACKSTITFRFTLWLLSVMNKSKEETTFKSCGKPMFFKIYHTHNCNTGFTIHQKSRFPAKSR